ncbi:hypothetical protein HPB47_014306 [Ixodes persulcatus]|uniref:Uncharacterized protein n=1 Tax=Ixodes persulcatus TaxID=34615 RepID=A0AC60QYY1_IXOPE|nr:hypothetical protein HPB47_014306 [Ixodes persulcatus]
MYADGGSRWSNLHLPGTPYDNVTLLHMVVVVSIYCLIYALFVWYLDNVWPWQYGIPKEPLFCFKWRYWQPPSFHSMKTEACSDSPDSGVLVEAQNMRSLPGIELHNVTKAYPGDVTVLLGRNGAGKTTLLRLITGLEQATEGTVIVGGHDVRRNEWALANTKIDDILVAFSLDAKRDALASSLSWGMRRKLQLGIAIVGDPLTVVLDEPTSGADPECKGALWECVLRFHEDKTMLLTTHSMEEADTLGDRIAVMAEGRLRCCGSPMFLRTTYVSVSVGALEDVLRRVEQGSDDPDRSNGGTPELPDCPCALVDANKDCSRGVRPQFRQRVGALLLKRFHYGRRDFKLPVLMIFLPLATLACDIIGNIVRNISEKGYYIERKHAFIRKEGLGADQLNEFLRVLRH